MLALLTFASTCVAEVAVYGYYAKAYNVDSQKFSIDGYDFIDDKRPFPIINGQEYIITEADTEFLPGESFRKLIFVFDVNWHKSHIFKTRIINNTNTARIIDVKENWRIEKETVGDQGNAYTELDANYDLTLEDGYVLNAHLWLQKNIYFLPGDEIIFLNDVRQSGDDFRTKFYHIALMRNGKKVANLGAYLDWVTGVQRKDNMHTPF